RVDGRDRGHGTRAAAPVAALVEELPGVLDAGRVPAEKQRADVVGEVAGHGELAPVEGGIADPGDALVRGELQGHEVAPRARDDDLGVDDLHTVTPVASWPDLAHHREAWGGAHVTFPPRQQLDVVGVRGGDLPGNRPWVLERPPQPVLPGGRSAGAAGAGPPPRERRLRGRCRPRATR